MTTTVPYTVPECAPIRVDADGPECCLCVHGFTSCPAVYTELAERLAGMGYALSAPLLPGHGTTPEDLGAVAELEWFEAVAREYEALRGRYRTIHVVGLSLGGAIASWLAASRAGEPGRGGARRTSDRVNGLPDPEPVDGVVSRSFDPMRDEVFDLELDVVVTFGKRVDTFSVVSTI